MTITDVRVMNTEINTPYRMSVRHDRLLQFIEQARQSRMRPIERTDWAMGVDGSAVIGLNAIFTKIPNKFPLLDMLRFLKEEVDESVSITLAHIEYQLSVFGQKCPGITGEGEDVL